jgi:hypothetical protein
MKNTLYMQHLHVAKDVLNCFNDRNLSARFEFLTAVLLNAHVFWDVTLCRVVNIYGRFERSDFKKTWNFLTLKIKELLYNISTQSPLWESEMLLNNHYLLKKYPVHLN